MRQPANLAWLLQGKRDEAKKKAWDSLARYKFAMFGYWASIWVHLNELCPDRQPNPFGDLVKLARRESPIFPGEEG